MVKCTIQINRNNNAFHLKWKILQTFWKLKCNKKQTKMKTPFWYAPLVPSSDCSCPTSESAHIFCSIGIFIYVYQIHKLQMFACWRQQQQQKYRMDTKEKQIINWWTGQIFVLPSISTYAHRPNNLYLFYFCWFLAVIKPSRLLFYLAVYVIYKFYFNNRHSINLVWCCSTHAKLS